MSISFGSINTGLPKDIVQQIMKAERESVNKVEVRKSKIQSKKTLLQDLIQRVEALRTEVFANKSERDFRELSLNSSNENVLTASADKNVALPGSYQLEVIQLARKSSAMTNGVEDADKTYLGVGYIQYVLPNGEETEIYVDEKSSSLNGIAKLINSDTENGMHANVVNDGSGSDAPYKLIIALENTGDDNRAEFPYLYFVDGEEDIYIDQERQAQDARIKIDGFEIEVPSNRATEVLPGVTLDLQKASPGEEVTLEIKEDTQKITEKLSTLVEKLNSVLMFIKEQNTLDENTDTSQSLGGDLVLQTTESRLRSTIFKTVQTQFGNKRLGDLGVEFEKTGLLKLDQGKLKGALDKNYKEVAQILTGQYTIEGGKVHGFMDHLETFITQALRMPTGILTSRKNSFNQEMRNLDTKISNKVRMLDKKEEHLKMKFAKLEETVSRIKSQGSGIPGMQG